MFFWCNKEMFHCMQLVHWNNHSETKNGEVQTLTSISRHDCLTKSPSCIGKRQEFKTFLLVDHIDDVAKEDRLSGG